MEASKEKLFLKLDPKVQDLYNKLEEERKKSAQLQIRNQQLEEKLKTFENAENSATSQHSSQKKSSIQDKRKIEMLMDEKKIYHNKLNHKQERIEHLTDSITEQDEVQQLDTHTIDELKKALDSFIVSRNKRVHLIEKLKKQTNSLLEENEDLKFTISRLSHDLRSLMASIQSTMELFEIDEGETAHLLIPTLKQKCSIFINLIGVLNNNQLQIEPTQFGEVVEHLNFSWENSEDQISRIINGNEIKIKADKAAIFNVIQNIVNNSVKYSNRSYEDLMINLEAHQTPSNTVIKITDNGDGIEAKHQQRIFKLFDRADQYEKEGKGIGLYVSQKLVEKHQGTLTYNSNYQKGAQFIITLPNE